MDKKIQDKLTSRLKNVLAVASETSKKLKHRHIGTEHILYGMVQETGSLSYSILKKFGVTAEFVRSELEKMDESPDWKEEFSQHARGILEKGARTAFQHQHRYIGTEHALFGLMMMKDCAAYKILENSPADTKALTQQIQIVLKSTSHFPDLSNFLGLPLGADQAGLVGPQQKSGPAPSLPGAMPQAMAPGADQKPKTPAIDYFTRDLTAEAKEGKHDPVVGRSGEVDRVMSILNRKTKNNPILIGDPGVGKTAIVVGLAQAIASGRVPQKLQGKRILSLDMASIIAGTTFRGEFEERIKELMRELETNRDTILFIDELHTIVGAGAAGGSLDAANMLKPALARAEISVIGATTMDEYRKYIEKDSALERRFQPVQVREPTAEETLEILQGAREAYEQHHGLTVTDEALAAAVEMSVRYIPDRFLPDKALDLLDEAAATLQLKLVDADQAQAANELKEQLEIAKEKKEHAIDGEHYEEALVAKREEDALSEKLSALTRKIRAKQSGSTIEISAEHIGKVVSDSTGIPVTKLLKSESKKLAKLEDILRSHIVGQEEAITSVARYVRRSRAGIAPSNRPLGSFIFLGPTGVGKTETAKILAKEVFENPEALIRVDMSEFMEGHSVSRLIGAPAGYVGYEEGGKLTEAVRRTPYSIVLFDEIEKAHRDVTNILLQILDEGQVTDSHGRSVSFRNTIVIMTSNVGSQQLTRQAHMGFSTPAESGSREVVEQRYEELKKTVVQELHNHMAPELIGRIDQTIVFAPLDMPEMLKITNLHIKELNERLAERNISVTVSKGVKDEIARRALEVQKGARPIRRIVQELLEDPIASQVINEEITDGQTVKARKTGGRVEVGV